jgi:hypothetical protein
MLPKPFLERQFKLTQLEELARLIKPSTGDVFVIFPDSDKGGVLRVPASIFRKFWKVLVGFQPDGFSVVDSECKNRLVIQILDLEHEEPVLDLAAWGDSWMDALAHLPVG